MKKMSSRGDTARYDSQCRVEFTVVGNDLVRRSIIGDRRSGARSWLLLHLVLLQSPHPAVHTLGEQQRGMAAPLDDPAMVEDQDFVGIDDGRQPMGDGEGRPVAGYLPQFPLDRFF